MAATAPSSSQSAAGDAPAAAPARHNKPPRAIPAPTPAYSALLQAPGPVRARADRHHMLVPTKAHALAMPAASRNTSHHGIGPGTAIAAVSTAVAASATAASRGAAQPVRAAVSAPAR